MGLTVCVTLFYFRGNHNEYAAVTGGTTCACFDDVNAVTTTTHGETDCNVQCSGNNYQYCGSNNGKYNVFFVGEFSFFGNEFALCVNKQYLYICVVKESIKTCFSNVSWKQS